MTFLNGVQYEINHSNLFEANQGHINKAQEIWVDGIVFNSEGLVFFSLEPRNMQPSKPSQDSRFVPDDDQRMLKEYRENPKWEESEQQRHGSIIFKEKITFTAMPTKDVKVPVDVVAALNEKIRCEEKVKVLISKNKFF